MPGKFVECARFANLSFCQATQDEAEVERGVTEANVFALASHQYWGTWALLQARLGTMYPTK